MGHCATTGFYLCSLAVFISLLFMVQASEIDDRCKDESFCKAYCLSTNPDTVSARCGRDMASCICITPDNHAVKVRFIEERTPVPSTPPTTTRRPVPIHPSGVQYVESQSLPNGQQYNYNGNGNSIAGGQNQQQNQRQGQEQQQPTPVLLECDASEMSTRMCHLFCTMEIRAWYGLCNITSKACACFGIPLSAVQGEPIAAIFHSTAPVTPAPIKTAATPRPSPSQEYQQFYPPQQYMQQQAQQPHQQQQWTPIQPTVNYQSLYNNNQYYPGSSPALLNSAVPQNNQHQPQGPVRSAASLFGSNGQPLSPTVLTPVDSSHQALPSSPVSSFHVPLETESVNESSATPTNGTSHDHDNAGNSDSVLKSSRKRRSLNDSPMDKDKDFTTGKDLSTKGECTRFKCGTACKRNNYLAPDCQPKCMDNQCWCECFPRL